MKKVFTRALTAACAAILCFSATLTPVQASVLAEEEAAAIVTDAPEVSDVPEMTDTAEVSDVPEMTDADEIRDVPETADATELSDMQEILTGASEGTWNVGDNVEARISSKNLYFISNNGQLDADWKEIIGDAVLTVENVSVSSGKMYLPEDSSFFFEDMTGIKSINTSGMDTSRVTDMAGMFAELSALTQLDLSGFSTSRVTDMYQMFYGCSALTELNLTGFSTSEVTDMEGMFSGCESLTRLDLTELDLRNIDAKNASTEDMFLNCSKLAKLVTPKASSSSIALPGTMYDASGKAYTSLPVLNSSMTLTADKPAQTGYAFSDVQDPQHAYFKAIYWAADAGITKGYPDGTFGINRSCTRGEMMMFLWRYAGKKAPKTVSKSPFKDVPKNHAFYKAILWGSQKGITKGYSDGTFGIDRNVSRGECMMFLWRLKGKPAPKAVAKSPFTDVPKNHVFYNAILWGAQKKITTGYTSGPKKGMFDVDANCTRGQIVTFPYRAK